MRITWETQPVEAGCDRGVFYDEDGNGVPWAGLISAEVTPDEASVEPHYFDGILYHNEVEPANAQASIESISSPSIIGPYEGRAEILPGFFASFQTPKTFGVSWRTFELTQFGEPSPKIHILFNATIKPRNMRSNTTDQAIEPETVTRELLAVPPVTGRYRPVAHVVLEKARMHPVLFEDLEDILYGYDLADSRLPDQGEIFDYMTGFNPIAFTEDPNDEGTYIIENRAMYEDPNRDGVYIKRKNLFREDPNDPGTFLNGG